MSFVGAPQISEATKSALLSNLEWSEDTMLVTTDQ